MTVALAAPIKVSNWWEVLFRPICYWNALAIWPIWQDSLFMHWPLTSCSTPLLVTWVVEFSSKWYNNQHTVQTRAVTGVTIQNLTLKGSFEPSQVTIQDISLFRIFACLWCFRAFLYCLRACLCCFRTRAFPNRNTFRKSRLWGTSNKDILLIEMCSWLNGNCCIM